MQRHTILINKRYSADTQPTVTTLTGNGQSFLVNQDNYFLNNVGGLNLNVVNPTNVRAYLNDPANDSIIKDFFSYLTGNTNQDQFREIFYSDQKLSNVFNSYYNQSVFSGQPSSTYYISQELTGTTTMSTTYTNFSWNGYAPIKSPFTGVTQEINNSTRFYINSDVTYSFTEDESYYIPVFIKKNYAGASRQVFDACDRVVNILLNPNYTIEP
jgi:hypothetical protein